MSHSEHSAAASTQLRALAWICFCGPGLFNALTSFASGLADPRVAFAGNALVYLSFAVCSLVAAALVPAIGVRRTLTIGSLGYFLYTVSLWNVHNDWLAPLPVYYAACVVLGVAAGFLWTAQGLMLLSYPSVESQGENVSRFWVIFNMGATAGGVISFALNFNQSLSSAAVDNPESSLSRASNGMYVVFLLLMGGGVALAWWVIDDSDNVVKDNGEPVYVRPHSSGESSVWRSWQSSVYNARRVVSSERHRKILLALLPLFAYSNWFYAYHSFYNTAGFNMRTSGLTSACYWLAQMGGAFASGSFLDSQMATTARSLTQSTRYARRSQAPWGTARQFLLGFLVLATVMWMIGWYVQDKWLRLTYQQSLNMDVLTTQASSLLPALLLYIVYGVHDALCQVWIYWFMSLVTAKDVIASGCYAGVYKSVQAASAALAWYLGAIQMDPLTQLQINVALCTTSVLCALRCCAFALKSSAIDVEFDGRKQNEDAYEADMLLG